MLPSAFDRPSALRRLTDTDFDVVVVGGGITGVGCALDAASRGLRTALVEREDFASGTSSKSSKLVHGGLRYLQQGEVGLVYEALAERQRLRHNAPHLVRILPFLLPVLTGKDQVVPRKLARALGSAMWMYDLTGGARIGKLHKRISPDEALAHMPTLPRERLAASYLYYDAQADDARLTVAVARTAALDHGAVVVNRAEVVGMSGPAGAEGTGRGPGAAGSTPAGRPDRATRTLTVRVTGPGGTTEDVAVRTRAVINAAGVWADRVGSLQAGRDLDTIRPAKGIHITVPWHKVRNDIAAVIPVPKDKRSVFVVPWGDFTYVGTTDTDYDGPLDEPQCTSEDVDYVLRALNFSVSTGIDRSDVLGTWAGLRPLVKAVDGGRTADLSRRHRVVHDDGGVVTVTGGKLTTYREMAADTIDHLLDHVLDDPATRERVARRSRTRSMALRGAEGYEEIVEDAASVTRSLDAETVEHLAGRYGGEAHTVVAMVEQRPDLGEPLVPGLPYLRAEALHAVRYEMATTLDDVLSRRTRARILLRDASAEAAPAVAELVAEELGWDGAEQQRQVEDYRARVDAERRAPDLPETALSASLGA
jgi:glycerol-3-phosphate dehydrogenase